MVYNHCVKFRLAVEGSRDNLMNPCRTDKHIAGFIVFFPECPFVVQRMGKVGGLGVAHDCAVVSCGVVFSFVFAVGYFVEYVYQIIHCRY